MIVEDSDIFEKFSACQEKGCGFAPNPKLYVYPKYSKHWLSVSSVAHTIDCVCSKILNHGIKSWVIIFTFQVFWVKKHSKLIENWGLKSRFLFCLIFQFYWLICQKPAQYLYAQMALARTFFQMFIVLGMYT